MAPGPRQCRVDDGARVRQVASCGVWEYVVVGVGLQVSIRGQSFARHEFVALRLVASTLHYVLVAPQVSSHGRATVCAS